MLSQKGSVMWIYRIVESPLSTYFTPDTSDTILLFCVFSRTNQRPKEDGAHFCSANIVTLSSLYGCVFMLLIGVFLATCIYRVDMTRVAYRYLDLVIVCPDVFFGS